MGSRLSNIVCRRRLPPILLAKWQVHVAQLVMHVEGAAGFAAWLR